MPKWICPTCSASHNVTSQHLGKTAKCQKCGQASEVVDSDAAEAEPEGFAIDTGFVGTLQRLRPPASGTDPQSASPGQSTSAVAKGLLCVILGIWFLILLISFASEDAAPFRGIAIMAVSALAAQLVLVWPFYTACDDLRAIRINLENKA